MITSSQPAASPQQASSLKQYMSKLTEGKLATLEVDNATIPNARRVAQQPLTLKAAPTNARSINLESVKTLTLKGSGSKEKGIGRWVANSERGVHVGAPLAMPDRRKGAVSKEMGVGRWVANSAQDVKVETPSKADSCKGKVDSAPVIPSRSRG